MRRAWVLPDPSNDDVLFDGWDRPSYQPRHGKPPVLVRVVRSAAAAAETARERYLGAGDEDSVPGTARPV